MNITTTLLFSTATGLISAYLAHRREKNPYVWFLIGFFFGMLGMLFLFFAPKKEQASKPSAPQPYIFGPADKFWYYLDPEQKQIGPMSHQALSDIWKEAKIHHDTLVWNEEMSDWKPLKDLLRN
jgi:hypothetical protein